jgi:hypothetical protein
VAEGVDEERGDLDDRAVAVGLPSDDTDPAAMGDTFGNEDVREWERTVTGLTGQAEVLEEVAAHLQRGGSGGAMAFVADEDGRVALGADHEDRLLEPGIESGEVRQVGAVLAVGVDHQAVIAAVGCSRSESLHPRPVDVVGEFGTRPGHAEVGEVGADQGGPAGRHGFLTRHPASRLPGWWRLVRSRRGCRR